MNGIGIQLRIVGLVVIGTVCSFIACGGGGSSPNTALTPTPSGVTVNLDYVDTNGNDTVTATVTGLTAGGKTMVWSVDGVAGGSASVGTIVGTGTTATYVAPTQPGNHIISAVSAADATQTASTPIRVFAPAMVVALSAAGTTVAPAGTVSLTASVTGTRHTDVNWTVDGVLSGNATTGTITGAGSTVVYTAPAAAGTHKVQAVSAVNSLVSDSTVLTVQIPSAVTVAVTPASSTILNGGTVSLTAKVTGSTNTGVTWSVDGVAGGNATTGTLTGTGATVVYNGPTAAGTHTVKATSAADANASGSASVTVQAPVQVVLNLASASIATGANTSVTATVSNASNTGVTWSVDGVAGGNASIGIISGTGGTVTYTAPSAAGSHTISAVSAADPTKSAASVVTVKASSGTGTTTAVALTPSTPTAVGSGGTLAFSASTTGASSDSVTWSVDGVTGGNSTVGTISSSGLYTCPAVSAKTLRRITATSVNSPSVSASVRILTVASNTTVNAKTQYGATGNGTTDDTAAITKALGATGSGICYVPAGTYLINPVAQASQFGLYLNSGNTLLLDPGAVLQCKTMSTGGGYAVVGMEENNIALVGGTIIGDRVARNLGTYIDGSGSDMEVGQGVAVANGSGMTVLGVTSKNNCCDGLYLYNNVSNVLVSDCVFDNNRRQGCSLVRCTSIVMQYSTFSNTNGNDPACGIDFEPNSGSMVSGVQVIGCLITGNVGGGIAGGGSIANGPTGNNSAGCQDCTITGCTITNNGGNNYKLGGIAWDESDRIAFTNNTITGNKGDGIWINYHALTYTITGNTVTGNQGDGIYLASATGTTVSGNTVTGNTGTAINNADGSATVGTNTTK